MSVTPHDHARVPGAAITGEALLPPRSALAAYRADLSGAPGVLAFADDDGTWVLIAELLARRARLMRTPGEAERAARIAAIDADLRVLIGRLSGAPPEGAWARESATDSDTEGPLFDAMLAVAEQMEERGALQLAYTTLVALGEAVPGIGARHRGLIFAQRARIARKVGALDTAHDLYADAARLGRETGDTDLVVRGFLGRAVLARRRGNYPAARRLYRLALRDSERAGLRELSGLAHHGLLIAASVAHDFGTALVHGWAAFERLSGDADRQADVLGTLGAVASEAGHHAAGLRAYLGAARRAPAARVRLPALGGAAVCAARLRDAAQLEAITRAVEVELGRDALPYERAQALSLLAEAWAAHAPHSAGEPYHRRALELARVHGFHELVHQMEQLSPDTAVLARGAGAPREPHDNAVPASTRDVLEALVGLDGEGQHRTMGVG